MIKVPVTGMLLKCYMWPVFCGIIYAKESGMSRVYRTMMPSFLWIIILQQEQIQCTESEVEK
jgi:hypothetical protein